MQFLHINCLDLVHVSIIWLVTEMEGKSKLCNVLVTHLESDFGGLEVACWHLVPTFGDSHPAEAVEKKIQFLPYGTSIGSWICLTHKTYTCHTVQNTIRYDIIFTRMKVRYTIFERVTMYNNVKRTIRKLQRFISTVILL
jgi:hypothetical protein